MSDDLDSERTSIIIGSTCYGTLLLYNVAPLIYARFASQTSARARALWLQKTIRDRIAWATWAVANAGRDPPGLFVSSCTFALRNVVGAYLFFGRTSMAISFILISISLSSAFGIDLLASTLAIAQVAILGITLLGSFLSFARGSALLNACLFLATTPPLSIESHKRLARAQHAAGIANGFMRSADVVDSSAQPELLHRRAPVLEAGRLIEHPIDPDAHKHVGLPVTHDDEFERYLEEVRRLSELIRLLKTSAWFWVVGIRLFYLGINAAFWMVNPWLLVISTTATLCIQGYGDFYSW